MVHDSSTIPSSRSLLAINAVPPARHRSRCLINPAGQVLRTADYHVDLMLAKAKLVLEYVYKSGAHATWGVDQQNRARKAASLNQSLNFVNVIVL
jgi:hypothetical protein